MYSEAVQRQTHAILIAITISERENDAPSRSLIRCLYVYSALTECVMSNAIFILPFAIYF